MNGRGQTGSKGLEVETEGAVVGMIEGLSKVKGAERGAGK